MRILQIDTERTWRGGERQTVYALEGLLDAGVETGLVCRAGSPLHRRARDLPVRLHPVRSTLHAVRLTASVARDYDLVHAQSAKGQSIAVLAKPFHRRPVLYTRRVNFPLTGLLTRLKYRFTDRTVAISTVIQQSLRGIGVQDVPVIPDAVKFRSADTDRARRILTGAGVPEGTKIVATVGDLVPQKGPLLMVDVIHELECLRRDFVFVQFGDDQMGAMVRGRIAHHGLGGRVHLLGHVEGVEDFFPIFDVYLVTGNETEGYNSSVLDAFVYDVPVVSTLAGGMVDSVADRGLSCDDGDAPCLARQVDRLLNEPELARELTERARVWALENATIPAITGRYLEIYLDLLERTAG